MRSLSRNEQKYIVVISEWYQKDEKGTLTATEHYKFETIAGSA